MFVLFLRPPTVHVLVPNQVQPDLAEEDLVNETFVNESAAMSNDPLHDMEDLGQVLLDARQELVTQDGVPSREMITPRQRKALTVCMKIPLLYYLLQIIMCHDTTSDII